MITWIGTSGKRLLAQCSENRSPAQIAWGLAIGASLGIVPMDNLTSAMLLISVMFLRVNQLAAAIACISVALICPFIGFLPNRVGAWLLSFGQVTHVIGGLYQVPGTAWFRLENTQVMGGLFLGMFTLIPNYYTCRIFVVRMQRKLATMAVRSLVQDAAEIRKTNSEPSFDIAAQDELNELSTSSSSAISEASSESPAKIGSVQSNVSRPVLQNDHRKLRVDAQANVESDLDVADSKSVTHVPPDTKATSKSKKKQAFHRASSTAQAKVAQPNPTRVDIVPGASETVLRETIIEVVRYREPIASETRSEKTPATPLTQPPHQKPKMIVESTPTSNTVMATANPAGKADLPISAQSDTTLNHPGRSQTLCGPKGSGSLRHLLRHITHSRETRTDSESIQ